MKGLVSGSGGELRLNDWSPKSCQNSCKNCILLNEDRQHGAAGEVIIGDR